MMQRWVLQGRTVIGSVEGDWLDLASARSIKGLPKVNRRIAQMLKAEYRVMLKVVA